MYVAYFIMEVLKTMSRDGSNYVTSLLRELSGMTYIKPGDIPEIDLYMDQVLTFMDAHLKDVKRHEDDKTLTKTMINNYTKNKLLPPPDKKKYSSDHLYLLAFIYYFKNQLSISDIQTLLKPLTEEFFHTEGTTSLADIYREVYQLQKEQLSNISRDVISQYKKSTDTFTGVSDDRQREYLQMFAFITMLDFDIYLKKNIIENIIDDLAKAERTSQ
jgi:hypothetical protein